MIVMACKTSGDSSRRVPGIISPAIQDSFTTQGLASKVCSGAAFLRPPTQVPAAETARDLRIFINT